MPDTPLELCENVSQQDFTEWLIELGEHVTDGIQRVVTCCCHPLGFLEADKQTERDARKKEMIRTEHF